MSLKLKYRPATLSAVAGNKVTKDEIERVLAREDPPHTFLLSGPRGCGKTTIARIIAGMVDCDLDHNFKEINAANFRGIDTSREIMGNMNFKGLGGSGTRVWLLDECHQMTKIAQEGMLKPLEEPPAHVFFVLSTTDPQKLLPTVIDRCVHLKVGPLDDEECITFLKKIARRERATVPVEILEKIAEVSEGRPRTALGLLEKVLGLPIDEMDEVVQKAQNLDTQVIDLCRALAKGAGWKQIASIIKHLSENEEPESIRRAVLGYVTKILGNGADDVYMYHIGTNFRKPFYDNGKADLILSAYNTVSAVEIQRDAEEE